MLRLALPTGDLRAPVAEALAAAGLRCDEYAAGSRALRLTLGGGEIAVRVFREKDIPIQIALGNYDAGICSAAWVEELHARFPQEDVTVLRPLAFGHDRLVVAAPQRAALLGPAAGWPGVSGVRIASEYPGIAERVARGMRLPRYSVLPVMGAAEAYPPEDADLALLAVADEREVTGAGLEPVITVLDAPAWLIAGRRSLAERDLAGLLGPLLSLPSDGATIGRLTLPRAAAPLARPPRLPQTRATVRLALPDGHAQRHTFAALTEAGLEFEGYGERTYVRRPRSGVEGLEIKVIRPQDMPQQVALGNFDLAITGRDVLMEHRHAFPASPAVEAVDLGRSRYTIAAAVSQDVPADTLTEAVAHWRREGRSVIRVASEYPNMADHFARVHHLGRYRIIPVSGASEAFVPEDSEILIEGTETGSSFRANRLKPIEQVMESTNCLIARAAPIDGACRKLVEWLVERLRRSTEG